MGTGKWFVFGVSGVMYNDFGDGIWFQRSERKGIEKRERDYKKGVGIV